MAKFEYIQLEVVESTHRDLSVILTERDGIDRFATSYANLVPFLNELGADGWEVVAMMATSSQAKGRVYGAYQGLEAETKVEGRVYLLKRQVA